MIWVDHIAGRYYLTLGGQHLARTSTPAGRRPSASGSTSRRPTTAATARFYVGGVEVASKTFTGGVGNSNTWRLGAYERTPDRASSTGSIDNVRIYDRALSAGRDPDRHGVARSSPRRSRRP